MLLNFHMRKLLLLVSFLAFHSYADEVTVKSENNSSDYFHVNIKHCHKNEVNEAGKCKNSRYFALNQLVRYLSQAKYAEKARFKDKNLVFETLRVDLRGKRYHLDISKYISSPITIYLEKSTTSDTLTVTIGNNEFDLTPENP